MVGELGASPMGHVFDDPSLLDDEDLLGVANTQGIRKTRAIFHQSTAFCPWTWTHGLAHDEEAGGRQDGAMEMCCIGHQRV
jgi:hypothetical protein